MLRLTQLLGRLCVLLVLVVYSVSAEAPTAASSLDSTTQSTQANETLIPSELEVVLGEALKQASERYDAVKRQAPVWQRKLEKAAQTARKNAPVLRRKIKKAGKVTESGLRASLKALRDSKVPQTTYWAMANVLMHVDRGLQKSAQGVNQWIDRADSVTPGSAEAQEIAKQLVAAYDAASDEEKVLMDQAANDVDALLAGQNDAKKE